MAEYIKREAAIKAMEKADCTLISSDADDCKADYLREIIESVPAADVVPVVRCKDCKYRTEERRGLVRCRAFNYMPMCVDNFCSYGERKDGGADNG